MDTEKAIPEIRSVPVCVCVYVCVGRENKIMKLKIFRPWPVDVILISIILLLIFPRKSSLKNVIGSYRSKIGILASDVFRKSIICLRYRCLAKIRSVLNLLDGHQFLLHSVSWFVVFAMTPSVSVIWEPEASPGR